MVHREVALSTKSVASEARFSRTEPYHAYSLRMFGEAMKASDDRVQHVFVKNYGMAGDWEAFERDQPLPQLIVKRQVAVIDFPAFIEN